MKRASYLDSIRQLEERGCLEPGEAPSAPPERRPRFDDDALGISFFRTLVEGEDFSNLTLPSMYFGRSEVTRCSFRNTDLRRSTMCWNDFVDVDFRDACLVDCDLRATMFERCNFAGAELRGAILGRECAIELTAEQRAVVKWSDEEPEGG